MQQGLRAWRLPCDCLGLSPGSITIRTWLSYFDFPGYGVFCTMRRIVPPIHRGTVRIT